MDYSISFGPLKITAHAIENCRALVSSLEGKSTTEVAEVIAKSFLEAFLKDHSENARGLNDLLIRTNGDCYKLLYYIGNACHILTIGRKDFHYLS